MRKLTKNALIVVLALIAVLTCAIGLTFNSTSVKTFAEESQESSTVVDITTISEYSMVDGAKVRVDFDADGKTDYAKNGLMFLSRIDATTYNSVKDSVVFGMLVLPTDYITTHGAVTTESVFGESAVYTLSADDTEKVRIAFVEADPSVEGQMILNEGYYYLQASMTNLKAANVDRDFSAFAYLKGVDSEGKTVYAVQEATTSKNMYDVALAEVSKENVAANVKVALLDCYVGEASQEEYENFAGSYTNAYTFNADKTMSYRENLYVSGKPANGTYKLYKNGIALVTVGDQTKVCSYDKENKTFTANGNTEAFVDTGAIYTAIAGDYRSSAGLWNSSIQRFILANDGTFEWKYWNWTGTYKVEPITEDFGRILTYIKDAGGNDLTHWGDASLGSVYYSNFGGKYKLRFSNDDVNDKSSWGLARGQFVDWFLTSDTFKTTQVFDALAGEYVDATVSKTYKDGEATLVLENDGGTFKTANNVKYVGVAQFNGQDATYNVVATSATAGKFFMDVSDTPSYYYSAEDKSRFVVGDYAIGSENITIEFTYDGEDYSFVWEAPKEVDDSVYTAFAGKYTDTYVFNADKTVTNTNLTTYASTGRNTTNSGTYVLLDDGSISITINGETTKGVYDSANGSFTVGNKTNTKVDMDVLYTALAGTDTSEYVLYSGTDVGTVFASASQGLRFYPYAKVDTDGYNATFQGYGWKFTYDLVPITETFGKIDAYITTNDANYDGKAIGELYYTYADGYMRLRLSGNAKTTAWSNLPLIAYGHFIDLNRSGDTFRTTSVFNQLAGEYVDTTVSKTYTGDGQTLVLENDGVLKLSVVEGKNFLGGKGILNSSAITYNFIKISDTSGLIFIDMSDTPSYYYTASDTTRFVQGEYTINGDVITITFNGYTLTYGAN